MYGVNVCIAAKMGFGRFFAETWVGSKPWFRPSDCMNASVDGSYLSGYSIPIAAIFPLCPNVRYSILLPPLSLPYNSSNASVSGSGSGSGSGSSGDRWRSGAYNYPLSLLFHPYPYPYSNDSSSPPREKELAQLVARLHQQYYNNSNNFSSYDDYRYGSECANASTLVSPRTFREKVAGFLAKSKGVQLQRLQQRSRAWYGGQDSALLAAWWEMYRRKAPKKAKKKKAGGAKL